MVKISDLRTMEIISIHDGKRLGNIHDIEIDVISGHITGLIMPGGSKGWLMFKHREEQMIPWEQITTIGQDVILVELEQNKAENAVMPTHPTPTFFNEEEF